MPHLIADHTTLYYREAGEGPLALFIHGFPLDHTLWLDQLRGLAHLRRCVAPDLRGFGRSDPAGAEGLPMGTMADDVAALIQALDADSADVVGLSMGGYVALALWERHPDLVRTLTLADTRATADGAQAREKRESMIDRLLDRGRSALGEEMVGALLGEAPSARARARLRTMTEATPYETLVAAIEGMKRRQDRTGLLSAMSLPVLVITGEEDSVIPPAEAEALAEAIPGARLVTIPGSGHLPPIEQPEAMTRALEEFWSS